jgi:ABC-2 type transport system ATP-binding protein
VSNSLHPQDELTPGDLFGVRESFESSDTSDQRSFLRVENLWVRKGGLRRFKWILKGVSLDVRQGEFVAIIGPNGAGKTKLLEAILGDRPYAGRVQMFEQDLYGNPEHWLQHTGWVPSYNVLHDTLRAEQALLLTAQLRLPGRSTQAIRQRVELLLEQLEFPTTRRQALIRELSSGERKRLDLCAELLNNPPLLILDEPTTNLDPDAERSLMALLRNRSWGKRQAVIVVTHTLQSLHYCDRIIYMAHGRVRAQGTYDEVLNSLQAELVSAVSPLNGNDNETGSMVIQKTPNSPTTSITGEIDNKGEPSSRPVVSEIGLINDDQSGDLASLDDASRWADIYRLSRQYEREEFGIPPPMDRSVARPAHNVRLRKRSWVHEFGVLLRRNWLLFRNNFAALALYLLLGPFSGLLSRLVLRDNAFIQDMDMPGYSSVFDTTDARQAVFIIALVVTLLGLIGSFLDITKERPIFRYERVKGLSPWAYLLSKWLILAVLVGLLAPSFLMLVLTFQGQQIPNIPYVMVTLYLACIAAVTLGLAISAAAASERSAVGLLGIVVVFHLFFSGGVDFNERLRPLLEKISVFAASHWAAQGLSTSIQVYCWAANPRFQDFASLGRLLSVWLYLAVYILAALILGFVALRLQDAWHVPSRRWRKAWLNGYVWAALPLALMALSWGAFLEQRSYDYYMLRQDQDTVRILDYNDRDQFQSINGLLSQSLCPPPPALPPPSAPMIALPPGLQTPTDTARVSVPPDPGNDSQVGGQVSVPTPLPTLPSELLPTEQNFVPLPTGLITSVTQIFFGPEHPEYPLETLPVGASFTLLGKTFDETWFRIKEDFTGREIIGWIPVDKTNLAGSQAGGMARPPACAIPRAYLEANGSNPDLQWTSDVSGHVVAVVDLFREQAGESFSPGRFYVNLNSSVLDVYPVSPTRQSFIFRGLSIDIRLNQEMVLQLSLGEGLLPGVMMRLRATIFFVPAGCSF